MSKAQNADPVALRHDLRHFIKHDFLAHASGAQLEAKVFLFTAAVTTIREEF